MLVSIWMFVCIQVDVNIRVGVDIQSRTRLNEQRKFSKSMPQTLRTPAYATHLSSMTWYMYFLGILVAAKLLLLAGKQSVDGRVELVAALEEVELEDEDVFDDLAAELLYESTRSRRGATW